MIGFRESSNVFGAKVAGLVHPDQRVAVGLGGIPKVQPEFTGGALGVGTGPSRHELHDVARQRKVEVVEALYRFAAEPAARSSPPGTRMRRTRWPMRLSSKWK